MNPNPNIKPDPWAIEMTPSALGRPACLLIAGGSNSGKTYDALALGREWGNRTAENTLLLDFEAHERDKRYLGIFTNPDGRPAFAYKNLYLAGMSRSDQVVEFLERSVRPWVAGRSDALVIFDGYSAVFEEYNNWIAANKAAGQTYEVPYRIPRQSHLTMIHTLFGLGCRHIATVRAKIENEEMNKALKKGSDIFPDINDIKFETYDKQTPYEYDLIMLTRRLGKDKWRIAAIKDVGSELRGFYQLNPWQVDQRGGDAAKRVLDYFESPKYQPTPADWVDPDDGHEPMADMTDWGVDALAQACCLTREHADEMVNACADLTSDYDPDLIRSLLVKGVTAGLKKNRNWRLGVTGMEVAPYMASFAKALKLEEKKVKAAAKDAKDAAASSPTTETATSS